MTDDLYFRQLLAGRQVAVEHPVAGQMANFMYLIGDVGSRQALIVDPAWDVSSLLEVAQQDDYEIVGALITHYHPDHVGGDLWGVHVEGVNRLLEEHQVPLYVNKHEAAGLKVVTGVSDSDMRQTDDGEKLTLGQVEIQFMHTPGHTPGSQCFLLGDRLVAGDTLFVQGCGRVDLPGADPRAMYESLETLKRLPDDTTLFPGHLYSPEGHDSMGDQKRTNPYLRASTVDMFLSFMGH